MQMIWYDKISQYLEQVKELWRYGQNNGPKRPDTIFMMNYQVENYLDIRNIECFVHI